MAAPCRCLLLLQGKMLVGSIRGLTIVDGDAAREILTEDGHPLGYVYSLFEDREGQIWVTTLGTGLWKFDEDGLTQVLSGSIPAQCNVGLVTVWFWSLEIITSRKETDYVDQAYRRFQVRSGADSAE